MINHNIHPALAELIPTLADAGLSVYAYPGTPRQLLSWVVAERDGNTCVVSISDFNAPSVTACIRPSREYGSGVMADIAPGKPDTLGKRIVDAAIKATEPTVRIRFCKVNPIVPNDGMQHFAWANLVKVTP